MLNILINIYNYIMSAICTLIMLLTFGKESTERMLNFEVRYFEESKENTNE